MLNIYTRNMTIEITLMISIVATIVYGVAAIKENEMVKKAAKVVAIITLIASFTFALGSELSTLATVLLWVNLPLIAIARSLD